MRGVEPPVWLAPVTDRFLRHTFDLLGSGWVTVAYGMRARGLEGHVYPPDARPADTAALVARQSPANRPECKRIRGLLRGDYRPIDWHLDFKSGFRWREDAWYRDIAYGQMPGVDVKVPWELARSQHLPLLAWAHAAALDGRDGFQSPDPYRHEFRDQVLDFIAANPPRFGVNWTCAMDVGIRAVNWLVAYDAFTAASGRFDDDFEQVFARSVYEHGRHIVANLEWSETTRGNHYLADVVGLLFVAAYLGPTDETDAWLALAIQELDAEAELQFTPDGANFEASTAYHRLSAEMLVYALALYLALPEDRLERLGRRELSFSGPPVALRPDSAGRLRTGMIGERLARAAEFAVDITRPDGRIAQIGDNDSGRLLKLGSHYVLCAADEVISQYANLEAYESPSTEYWLEEHLDLGHLVDAVRGVIRWPGVTFLDREPGAEAVWTSALAGGRAIEVPTVWPSRDVRIGTVAEWEASYADCARWPSAESRVAVPDARAGIEALAYPGFGLYLLRSPRVWLAVRCGHIGQNGNGGHAHNDQLALELFIDGEPRMTDPGTYLYTPLPHRRDEYRSVRAHAAPHLGDREPASLDGGLFRLADQARARCVYFGELGFLGYHAGYGPRVWRRVAVAESEVVVIDWVEDEAVAPDVPAGGRLPFSPGYGWRLRQGGLS